MRSYSLNPEAAKAVGTGIGIEESGLYFGKFVRAEIVTSKSDTEGVEFDFVSEDGRTANFLTCWTYTHDGKETYGLKVLNAIMAVLKVRGVQPTPARIKRPTGAEADGYELAVLKGRPLGLVLQREEYEKNDGSVGYKFNIIAPCEVGTKFSAKEILERATQAEQIDAIVSTLKDKQMRRRPQSNGSTGYQYGAGGSGLAPHQSGGGGAFDDMGSDIPFAPLPRRALYVF